MVLFLGDPEYLRGAILDPRAAFYYEFITSERNRDDRIPEVDARVLTLLK
jgi:hypothetical protein